MSSRCNVLFLKAPADNLGVKLSFNSKGFDYTFVGSVSNVSPFLKDSSQLNIQKQVMHPRRQSYDIPKNLDVVFNEIADADNCPKALAYCAKFLQNLKKDFVVINNPLRAAELTRDEVYRRLRKIELLNCPKTVAVHAKNPQEIFKTIQQEKLSFPVLVRPAGDHGGKQLLRLNTKEDLELLHAFAFNGQKFYLTQYVEYADQDGFYHKMRLVVIDGKAYPRHRISSTEWCVHGHNRVKEGSLVKKEEDFLQEFSNKWQSIFAERIQKIAELMELDYFGIDCALLPNDELLIFEANSTMNMLVNPGQKPNAFEKPIQDIIQAIEGMIVKRMKVK